MTPKEANENLVMIIKFHLQKVQGGEFGNPTIEDLKFCGKLHKFLEELE